MDRKYQPFRPADKKVATRSPTDYRVEGPFCDLVIVSGDSVELYYSCHRLSGVQVFLTMLTSARTEGDSKRVVLKLPHAAETIDRYLNWVTFGPTDGKSFLRHLQQSDLIDLGQFGSKYGIRELVVQCVEGVKLPDGLSYTEARRVVQFVTDTGCDLKDVASRWLEEAPGERFDLPIWPKKFWESCLACEMKQAAKRRLQMMISIQTGISPPAQLVRRIADDAGDALALEGRQARKEALKPFSQIFEYTGARTGHVVDGWRLRFIFLAFELE